ncbi:MAG: hypothetical protein ACK5CY_10440 [Bacteroidia bacterium]
MAHSNILKIWALNQSAGMIFGWFFHSVISHLWTGDHEYVLTTNQLLMHIVSLTGCMFIYLYFQNRATMQLFGYNVLTHWAIYLSIPLALFWVGFYLIGVPTDVLFWFLSVGFFNGYFLKKGLKWSSNSWVIGSTLSAFLGFMVAIMIFLPLDSYLSSLKGLMSHVILFTLMGILIGVPMSILGGYILQKESAKQSKHLANTKIK